MRNSGPKAIAQVGKTQPAALLKIIALILPKEHRAEHSRLVSELSDQQLNGMIEVLTARVEARAAGIDVPPLIDVTPDGEVRALPAPPKDAKPINTGKRRINPVLEHAETAVVGRPGYKRP